MSIYRAFINNILFIIFGIWLAFFIIKAYYYYFWLYKRINIGCKFGLSNAIFFLQEIFDIKSHYSHVYCQLFISKVSRHHLQFCGKFWAFYDERDLLSCHVCFILSFELLFFIFQQYLRLANLYFLQVVLAKNQL